MGNFMLFFKELIDRLKSSRPDFFKRLQKMAFILFVIFLGITYLPDILTYLEVNYEIPGKIIIISEKLYQAFMLLFGFSFLPKDDKVETPKTNDNANDKVI